MTHGKYILRADSKTAFCFDGTFFFYQSVNGRIITCHISFSAVLPLRAKLLMSV
jgi:hypothetical protein